MPVQHCQPAAAGSDCRVHRRSRAYRASRVPPSIPRRILVQESEGSKLLGLRRHSPLAGRWATSPGPSSGLVTPGRLPRRSSLALPGELSTTVSPSRGSCKRTQGYAHSPCSGGGLSWHSHRCSYRVLSIRIALAVVRGQLQMVRNSG